MTITGTPPNAGTPTTAAPTSSDAGSRVMGKDEFLKLLVTQLSNQDPLNPMDGQQFAAQLAQFSSVEQLMNISNSIGTQSEMSSLMAQNINNGVATGLIGKHIEAESGQVGLQAGQQPLIGFELTSGAAVVDVSIKDAAGRIVRTLNAKNLPGGQHELMWDGRDSTGNQLPEGAYTFEVKAKDTNGDAVSSAPRVQGVVDRISFGPEGIRVWMGSNAVPLASVVSVEQASP